MANCVSMIGGGIKPAGFVRRVPDNPTWFREQKKMLLQNERTNAIHAASKPANESANDSYEMNLLALLFPL